MHDSDSTVEYREIEGFEGYRVGNDGSVWTRWGHGPQGLTNHWRRKKPTPGGGDDAYLRLVLTRNGKGYTKYVHRLVLEAFVGPCPDGMEGCHDDGNTDHNWLSNLRWDTPKENQADRIRHGTDIRGEKQWRAKMTADQVREIRAMYEHGCEQSYRETGLRYGIEATAVYKIVRRKTWQHVA